jgi:hypothetical protein
MGFVLKGNRHAKHRERGLLRGFYAPMTILYDSYQWKGEEYDGKYF